jgi:hypothetical protein
LFFFRKWSHYLRRFSSAPAKAKESDEPVLLLRRNVFFHKRDEVKIRREFNIFTRRFLSKDTL